MNRSLRHRGRSVIHLEDVRSIGAMRPHLHPTLVNGPFGDPAVYVDFLHERRAILFDLGDISLLPPRKILRVSDIFVSHTHIDHFIGFDHFVRVCLGRDKRVRIFGPPGFVDRVEHRLAAYTWNLVENYPTDFTLTATEIHEDGTAVAAEFHCLRRFVREARRSFRIDAGVLLDDGVITVRACPLDHRTPSLAFVIEEKEHVNIIKNRLEELGLPVGPWLTRLKQAIVRKDAPATPFTVQWREGGEARERVMLLGDLQEAIVHIVRGQKIAYVTDAVYSEQNAARIISLAGAADYLFIEATFLHEEAERAAEKCHLTARQAGEMARAARVGRVVPFHFSAKYKGEGERLERELEEAFSER